MADAVDSTTADAYGDFADQALKTGDFGIALEAAELGILFGPEKTWITMNRAHAHMFLGRTEEARAGYLKHHGETIDQGPWDDLVVADFGIFRQQGFERPLMREIELLFKPSPSGQ
jgi:accessory colonization factor AcfC